MSNETLDEAGVIAKFGVRADQVLDLLTLTGDAVDNIPGVPRSGPKTAAKWLAQYGTLDNVIANARRDRRRGRRQPARGARVAAAGQAAADGEERLRAAGEGRPTSRSRAPDDATAARAVRALRIQAVAARTSPASGDAPDAAGAIAKRAATRRRGPALRRADAVDAGAARRRAADDRTTRRCIDEAALARWLDAIDARRAHVASTPRRRASIRCRRRSSASRSRSSPAAPRYIPLAHRYAGAPDQLDRDAMLARLGAVARRRGARRSSARTSSTTSTCSPTTASTLARRRARHAARVVRARGAQAARHGQPRVAPSRP